MNDEKTSPVFLVDGAARPAPQTAVTLLEWLRDELQIDAVRTACETGHCGLCAVQLDASAVKACSVLASQAQDRAVVTAAGLRQHGSSAARLLVDAIGSAMQCGYCLPAFVFAAAELLERTPNPPEHAVRRALDGLLCRCTGYQSIVEAVLDVAARTGGRGGAPAHEPSEPQRRSNR